METGGMRTMYTSPSNGTGRKAAKAGGGGGGSVGT